MDPTLSSKMVGFNRAKGEICSECSASSLLQVITPGIFECFDVSWVLPAETILPFGCCSLGKHLMTHDFT